MNKPEVFTGNVTDIASNGQGIVRQDGLVTFIPFTAPGDTVRYTIAHKKRNFAIGSLQEVVEPSPKRTSPQCPYFGTCGGCQLQHMRYDAQLAAKRRWIEDALHRIGGLADVPVSGVIPSHLEWHYRRRINLHLIPHQGTYEAGYTAIDNRTLVKVGQCPIFTAPTDPIITAVQAAASRLKAAGPEEARVAILKRRQEGYLLHFHFKKMPANFESVIGEMLADCPYISGASASSHQKTLHFGVAGHSIDVDGLHIEFSPTAFIQSHPEQSLNIYREIVAKAKDLQPKTALDLYCGIGISTLLLAREGIPTIGVESNPEAVRLAESNSKKNKIANAQFIASDVAGILESRLAKGMPDLVIANPPREGLSPKVLDAFMKHPVKALIYISCMPSTLARDLKHLCQNGYRVASVQPFDMFPQTIHVETMTLLQN